MVLFKTIVEITAGPMPHRLSKHCAHRPWVEAIAIRRHPVRAKAHGGFRGTEEHLRRPHVPLLARHCVDQVAITINRPIEVLGKHGRTQDVRYGGTGDSYGSSGAGGGGSGASAPGGLGADSATAAVDRVDPTRKTVSRKRTDRLSRRSLSAAPSPRLRGSPRRLLAPAP